MSSEIPRYTDEKQPLVTYLPVIEAVEVKKKRPLWRRFVRVLLTVFAAGMIWSTVSPFVSKCHMKHGLKKSHGGTGPVQQWQPHPEILATIGVKPDDDTPTQHFKFDPELENFWIRQESFSNVPSRTDVIGRLYAVSCSKVDSISAHLKFETSDDAIRDEIVVEAHDDGILFKANPFSIVKQKVNVTIHIIFPVHDDYKLERLRIDLIQPNIILTESLRTAINSSYISTVSGSVAARGTEGKLIDFNNLKVRSVSGDIVGDYAIENALSLSTTSGDIAIRIHSEKLPEEVAWLRTDTTSGSTTAAFVGALNPRPLFSKHTSVSGPITIVYPEDWQGGLDLKTTSGKFSVEGEGTKIIKKEKNIAGKFWQIIKGDGKSKGYIGTVSGNVELKIGKTDDNSGDDDNNDNGF